MAPRLLPLLLSFIASFLAAELSLAAPAMRFLYNGPESVSDIRRDYSWKVLHAALERTRREYGEFEMASAPNMNETRQMYEIQHDAALLNTMSLAARPELDQTLVSVKIPIDRGILGFRVFLIRAEDQARFDKIDSLASLSAIRIGVGEAWVDKKILTAAGLQVVGGSSYEGLFKMLAVGRFDAFSRSVVEAVEEFDGRRTELPNLAIEKGLLLYYPMPAYFWFPKTTDGERRAARVRLGMTRMIADGTLQKMFLQEYGPLLARLDLKHRRIIKIVNSQLGTKEPLTDRALWYDPLAN
jgi:ABC-type amino acid transport substrate-binding protein